MGIIQSINESYIEQIQQLALNGYWHYFIQRNKLTISPILYDIHELPQGKPITFDDIINDYIPAHKILLYEHFNRLVQNREPYDLELIIITPSKKEKWVRTTAIPVIKNNQVVEVIGMYQDITKSKLVDIEGERAKLRLKLSLAATKTGVWDWDSTNDHLIWDDTMFEIFEVDKKNFDGSISIFEKILHPKDKEDFYKLAEESIRTLKDYITTYRIITPFGKVKHIAARGRADASRFNGIWFTGINWDITDEVKQKEVILSQEAKIIASSRLSSLGEMAGGIAHEINNPLSIIQGLAESLKKRIQRGQIDITVFEKGLEKIESTCDRIVRIVKGLRSFSRDSEKDPFTVVKLGDVFKDIISLIQEKLKMKAIDLKIEDFEDYCVLGRSAQLGQVFMNLLSNSLDAIENQPNKWIHIKPVVTESYIQIYFCDSGHGIPTNIEEKIMQPFFTTKDVGKGTGLGLSISKGIIEDHQGKLSIDNSSKNTCFIIELPRYNVAK